MSASSAEPNPEDDVEASRAPLLDHLIELRTRLIKVMLAFIVGFAVCFFFSTDIFNLLVDPYNRIVTAEGGAHLIYTAPQEFFITKLKLSMFGAIFLAFPIIAAQVYMFVAPGLYKHERGRLHSLSDCHPRAVSHGRGTRLLRRAPHRP